jgi:magnesium transporter
VATDGESLAKMLEDEGIGPERLRETLELVHPVDLAEDLEDLDLEDRVKVFAVLKPEQAASVLGAMAHESRVALVDAIGEERLTAVIDAMAADVVADVIDHLPAHREKAILDKLDVEHRQDIQELSKHAANTAGGRMTKNYVSVPEDFTAGQTLKALQGAVTAETVSNLYVVDAAGRLAGVAGLGNLLRHPPEALVGTFMRKDIHFVSADLDQEEVAKIARKYNLRAVPVVEGDRKLVGVVTLASLLDVVHEEANEDVMKIAGAGGDPLAAGLTARVMSRLPWLMAAMGIELVLALVMKGFEQTLQMVVALASFIPIIMAMGGNVGLQSSTTVVRGLATGDITPAKAMRIVFAEFRVGVLIGLLCGASTALVAYAIHLRSVQVAQLTLIVFISMVSSITIAATIGALIPFVLHRLKRDPAVASGPFITAFNDMMNVVIYLTLATLLIRQVAP